MRGGILPNETKVGVLRVEHVGHRFSDLSIGRGGAGGCFLPEEVAQLLGRVWVAVGRLEDGCDGGRCDRLTRPLELPLDVLTERLWIDRTELDLLRATPERLVLVTENVLHHLALATEVDMCDLWLLLEHGAHQAWEVRIDVDDLLKLVQYQHDGALALAGELPRQLEQPLQCCVDVLFAPARIEAEAQRAILWIDRDGGRDPQALEDAQSLLGPEER